MPALRVSLNGISVNPFHNLGLTRNPFAQLGKVEHMAAEDQLAKLAADPIPDVQYIRSTLNGHFSDEFIQFCVDQFIPGRYVIFTINWD